jgi:putative polymerase
MKLALQAPPLQFARSPARADLHPVSAGVVRGAAPFVVYAALLFNFALCFLKTRGLPIGQFAVIGVEVVILGAAGALIFRTMSRATLTYFLLLAAYLGFVRYFNTWVDLKIGIDLAIPVLFWVLGEKYGDVRGADNLVLMATVLVAVVGLFEWFWVDEYQKYFDIFQYYVDKGSADASQATVTGTKLFVSGIRPVGEGREVLPGLGNHRDSSIFLEPIGAGNFGALVFLWAIHRFRAAPRVNLALIVAALGIIILADTRLGAVLCVIGLLSKAIPLLRKPLFLFLLPALMPLLILYVTAFQTHGTIDNGFVGRIYSSGHLLQSWDLLQWMGLEPSPIAAYDAGYGYLISNFGILPSLLLWAVAVRRTGLVATGGFGLTTVLYLGVSLCVTGSPFSIKTAALLWFLNGVLAHRAVDVKPAASAVAHVAAKDRHGRR